MSRTKRYDRPDPDHPTNKALTRPEVYEARRLRAAELFAQGHRPAEVAEMVGVTYEAPTLASPLAQGRGPGPAPPPGRRPATEAVGGPGHRGQAGTGGGGAGGRVRHRPVDLGPGGAGHPAHHRGPAVAALGVAAAHPAAGLEPAAARAPGQRARRGGDRPLGGP